MPKVGIPLLYLNDLHILKTYRPFKSEMAQKVGVGQKNIFSHLSPLASRLAVQILFILLYHGLKYPPHFTRGE